MTGLAAGDALCAWRPALLRRFEPLSDDLPVGCGSAAVLGAPRVLEILAAVLDEGGASPLSDYLVWCEVVLRSDGLPETRAAEHAAAVRRAVLDTLDGETRAALSLALDEAMSQYDRRRESAAEMANALQGREFQYTRALLEGDRDAAAAIVRAALDEGVELRELYEHLFLPSQVRIGQLWERNLIGVAREHFCTAATQVIMASFYPQVFATPRRDRTLLAACVGGELHEFGLRMVSDFFEFDGWSTRFFGANTPTPALLEEIETARPDAVALSVTMPFHLYKARALIEGFRGLATASRTLLLIGGRALAGTLDLWRVLGADGTSTNATDAVAVANCLVRHRDAAGGAAGAAS